MFSAKSKIQLTRVIIIALVCTLLGLFLSGLEYLIRDIMHSEKYLLRSALIANLTGGFLGGVIFGSLEIFYFRLKFKKSSFWKMILYKDSIYFSIFLGILFLASFFYQLDYMGSHPFDPVVWQNVFNYLGTKGAVYTLLTWGSVLFTVIFMIQINDRIGVGNLYDVFVGTYHKPKEEFRIFMFLDISGATSIAEKLGNIRYYEFLNDFFEDVSDPILFSNGEVYQYVGDEVTISWILKYGRKNSNCISCFFDIKSAIEKRSSYYINKYNVVPKFKAGMHCGIVSVGEVGVVKKEIVFSGDVLNTASRIRSVCNELNADLLVSQKMMSLIYFNDEYTAEYVGQSELKGKLNQTGIYKVSRNN